MIRRIVFVEPIQERVHLFSRYNIPRLGSLLLATMMKERGYETRVLFLSGPEVMSRLEAEGSLTAPGSGSRVAESADLVAISTITPTVPEAYRLADHLRSRGIPVVMGGPHVSFLPEEGLAHADFVICGEGEAGLPRLVEALNGKASLEGVPGLAWRQDGAVRRNPLPELIEDLDSLPFPDFGLLDTGGRRMGGPFGREIVPVQTSRGCPFDCIFCSVTCMFGRRYRYRSTESVIAELERYDRRRHFLFFYDDNFASNPRRAKDLLRQMIVRGFGFSWMTQVRADVARDGELLDLMAEAGCTYLFIGFESVDPQALREMHKGQSVEEIERAIAEIHRRGIHVHGMFVLGFDADTLETARATVRFAVARRIDTVQFLALTPIPGTELFRKLEEEGRILDRDWGGFDGLHVKHRPRGFSPAELQAALIDAHRRFYTLGRVLERLFSGRVRAVYLSVFARWEIRRWLRRERGYLKDLRVLPEEGT
ncbi:MAG: radical SAM protein [Spirochaetales bacterium]|nr:radical SAM protein [Spirochaetales bacterium]